MNKKMKINNNPIPVELEKVSNSTGITLIALIITIIIMLILAGITMYLFSNEGPIEHAKMSEFATSFREIEERVELYRADKYIEQVEQGNVSQSILPVANKMTAEEKETLKKEKKELEYKIMQLSEKTLEEVNLYWIDQSKIQTNQKARYIIDIETGQIYQYEGKTIYKLRWHTLDGGLKKGTQVAKEGEDIEIWDGWIRLTLYYPTGAKDKKWRIGEEGETRYDKNLMWQEYTGPIWVRLKDVENVWIGYNLNGEDVVIAPSGRLAVDIRPDSYYPDLTDKVKIQIYYDKTAILKEYKVGNGPWQEYKEEFYVTENTIVEARAKKEEVISDSSGNVIGQREIWGRDNIYVGNIGIEQADLEAPTLIRKAPDSSIQGEVAKLEVQYPDGAVKKIYKINYGIEEEYTQDISITKYGTHIIAYYYNGDGKRSKASQIIIDEKGTSPGEYIPNPPGKPQSQPQQGGSNPTTPSYVIPGPNINVSPSGITDNVSIKITPPSGYSADKMYYKIGNGNYQEYTDSFTLGYNTSISAYYVTTKGEISSTARIRIQNIQQPGKPYVKLEANPDSYNVPYDAGKVNITIISKDANKVEYSLNGITYQQYTGSFDVTKNGRIYAKGTNNEGETIEYIDITNLGDAPTIMHKLNISFEVNPEPKLTNNLVEKVKVTINYDERSEANYYKIGNGQIQNYTGSFEITENATIYAYAVSVNGKGQNAKQIDNLTKGISAPEIIASPGNATRASKVNVDINFDRTANITRYKIGNGSYIDYTGPIEITENCTITAYNKNKLAYEATSTYNITNIVPSTTIVIDKGKYYLLKLNYPPQSTGREYKWQENGNWKSYKEPGILLIKPEYKDEILNASGVVKIKIEDENGKLIDFNGDYYFVTDTVQELLKYVYLRWDRTALQPPTIILNTEEPTKEVEVFIQYPNSHEKKEYKIVNPDGTSSNWQDYNGTITITNKNTIVYARGQDEAEVWSKESMKKIINIDEEPPVIKVTADLQKQAQKVGIKVEVTDDVKVETVMWAQGIRGESYFNSQGNIIQNNTIFYVAENGYYTIYAKDGVGNTSTYTLQVTNVDLTAPNIQIAVTPENTIGIEVKINIDYGDSTTKEYKIGENNSTWTTYTGEITLTSNTVIANNWKNQDNTVNIYAKGKDSVGNETVETQKILSLDLDEPKTPVITSNYGYPILTEYGVQFDGETIITYDTRKDIDNYYSTNNGTTWQKYTGTFQLPGSGTIIAKSIKQGSRLEVIASKTIKMPTDAVPPRGYDGDKNTNTGEAGYDRKIKIDESMFGRTIDIYGRFAVRPKILLKNGTVITITNAHASNTQPGSSIVEIPQDASEFILSAYRVNSASSDLYEINTRNSPVIKGVQHYPKLTLYGVEKPYTIATISYFPTSVQRLYKIDDGSWSSYQDKEIRLEIGQKLYAKGIDKNGNETIDVSSYTSTVATDAVPLKGYDGDKNTNTGEVSYDRRIKIDESMFGRTIDIYGRFAVRPKILLKDGTVITITNAHASNTQPGSSIVEIPQDASEFILSAYRVGSASSDLYEISPGNAPVIAGVQHYPKLTLYGVEKPYTMATINYFPTSVQRLYKIDDGSWSSYRDKEIRLEIGQKLYAKGIDRNGNETINISSYTSTVATDAVPLRGYDGDRNTNTGEVSYDRRIKIDESMYGKTIEIYGRFAVRPKILLKDGTVITITNAYGSNTQPGSSTVEIPQNASEFILSAYRMGSESSDLYEINPYNI